MNSPQMQSNINWDKSFAITEGEILGGRTVDAERGGS